VKARIDAFLCWAREVSHGPNGTPSSQRVAGLFVVTVLEAGFALAALILLKRGSHEAFQNLFEANAILAATLFGLITVSKFGQSKKEEP
jgi:hypothetical protein